MRVDGLSTLKLKRGLLTYLVRFFMLTSDVFFYAEAGAHFIDSPYAFPHFNILSIEYTAQYTQKT
jgi:hypothetical protein